MGHANGKITAPVNTGDVKVTIGENSHDVGTLCTSGQINPAARFKPVRIDGVVRKLNYWKAHDGNCGLVPKEITSFDNIDSLYDGNLNGWVYEKPDGTWWKRLADFVNYDHNAKFSKVICSDTATTEDINFPVVLSEFAPVDDASRTSLRFSDLAFFSDGYLGIYATNGIKSFYFTADKKLSEQSASVVFINWKNRAGNWYLFPILCTHYRADGGSEPAGQKIYSIPSAEVIDIRVLDAADLLYVIGFMAPKGSSSSIIEVTVTGVNNTSKAVNFGNIMWRIKGDYGNPVTTDKSGTISSFGTVSAKSSVAKKIEVSGCDAFIAQGYAILEVSSSASSVHGFEAYVGLLKPIT